MILHVKFIRASGRLPWHAANDKTGRKYVQSYCYDSHTTIVDYQESASGFEAILRTEALTEERAEYLARYQSDRFRSALVQAQIFDSLDAMAVA